MKGENLGVHGKKFLQAVPDLFRYVLVESQNQYFPGIRQTFSQQKGVFAYQGCGFSRTRGGYDESSVRIVDYGFPLLPGKRVRQQGVEQLFVLVQQEVTSAFCFGFFRAFLLFPRRRVKRREHDDNDQYGDYVRQQHIACSVSFRKKPTRPESR